jgi:hypothetical protein
MRDEITDAPTIEEDSRPREIAAVLLSREKTPELDAACTKRGRPPQRRDEGLQIVPWGPAGRGLGVRGVEMGEDPLPARGVGEELAQPSRSPGGRQSRKPARAIPESTST